MAKCRGCGAQIKFIETKSGQSMPVELAKTTIVTTDGNTYVGHQPHWVKCPKSDKFRKSNRSKWSRQ